MPRFFNGYLPGCIIHIKLAFLFLMLCTLNAHGATAEPKKAVAKAPCAKHNVLVKKPKKLAKQLKKACPGSVIRLAEGVWKDVHIIVNRSGSQEHPITLKADKPGKTFIEGKSTLEVRGNYIHTEDLVFRNGSPLEKHGAIIIYSSHNRLTNTTIDGFDVKPDNKKTPWITIHGFHHEISHNHIKNKTSKGVMLIVMRQDDRAQYHKIHSNHFENFASGKGENGWETIRIGDSQQSTTDSHTLVENNLFEQCDGEIEIISVKSGKNIIRGNTFIKSEGLITLRHGKGTIVENNIFLTEGKANGAGIRLYDQGHIIRNNYISGIRAFSGSRGGVVLLSGTNEPGKDASTLNGFWTAYDITIENNTIYDSQQPYIFNGKRNVAVKNISFKNNVVVPAEGSKIFRVDLAPMEVSFDNELYHGTESDFFGGAVENFEVDKGIIFSDLSLSKNDQGLWLHGSLGAQNLKLITKADVGPVSYQ